MIDIFPINDSRILMKAASNEDERWPVLPTLGFYPKILEFFWDIGIFMGFLF